MSLRVVLSFVLLVSTVFAGKRFQSGPGEEVVVNEVLVKFAPGANPIAVIARSAPGAVAQLVHNGNLHKLRFNSAPSEALLDSLAADRDVIYTESNHIRHSTLANPNDTSYNSQWALNTVRAMPAWKLLPGRYLTSTSPGSGRLKVAVIDTGADCTHADFKNSGGTSTFSSGGGQFSATQGQAFVPTTTPNGLCVWQDDRGHGTHVSGTIAAATNNAGGVSGLAYGVELVIFKVLDASGSGTDADVSAAIVAAADAGAKVISMSLGGPGYSQSMQDAVTYAWEHDALVVAAAGNSNNNALFFPAAAHHAMAVAATDSANAKASFSNFGKAVDIAAPGVSILSTYRGGYANLSGTSMATPHVSALAALVAIGTPGIAAAGIVEQIQRTANSTTGGGWDQYLGYGIIDAANAISSVFRSASSGAVTGQLTDLNRLPVSGMVTLNGQSVTVDNTGLFRIAPIAAGTYVGNAVAGAASVSQSISVVAGADTSVTFQFGVPTGTFSGTVSAAGVPLQGAVVQAVDANGVEREALSDAAGHYSLTVKAGSYSLRSSQAGHVTAVLSGLAMTAGSSQALNLVLEPMGTVSGVVRDGNGATLANAEILLSSATFTGGAVTNLSGAYSTIGIPSGTYTATATAAGHPAGSSSTVTVTDGSVASLDFTMGTSITVTVSPASQILAQSQTVQFTATVSGTSNQAVTWSRTPAVGTISSTGLYTAPSSISSTQSVTVTATSVGAPSRFGTAAVTVANVFTLSLSPNSVAGGVASTSNKITLDTAAGSGGSVVNLSSSNPGVASVLAQVTVAAGATVSPLFTITTAAVSVATPVTISTTYNGITKTGTLTVRPVALLSVTASPNSIGGGGSTTSNRVTLDGPAPANLAVALSSSDPAALVPASVTVTAGQTSSPYFTINTSAVSSATPATITAAYAGINKTAVLTINPIVLASLSSATSVVGGMSATSNRVTLNGPAPAAGIVVTLSSSNPAVASVPASVTVAAGQSLSPYFTITTASVTLAQTVVISAAAGGVTKTANLSVVPAALSALTLSPTSLAGGAGGVSNRVSLSGPAPAGGAVVALSSSNPAVASVPGSVTVLQGQTTSPYFPIATFAVSANTTVTITATYNGLTKTATLTVRPVALYTFTLSPSTLKAGASGTANKITLDGPAGASGAAVSVTSSNNAMAQIASPVTVPPGATSATFTITSSVVTASTPVTITASFGGVTKTATLTVNPIFLSSLILSPTSAFAGVNTTSNRVTLDAPAPAGGTVVTLVSSDPAAASVPASVTVAAGATSSPYFTITTYAASATKTVPITATLGGSTKTANLTVKLAALMAVTVSPASTKGGTATTSNRVTLDGPAPPGGFTATLTSSDPTLASVPANVTIPAGATSAYFTVNTTAVTTTSNVTITATANGVSQSGTLSVTP